MLSLEHVSYYLPERKLNVEENLKYFNLTATQAKVYSKIYGLQQIPYAQDLPIVDFIKKPIIKLIDETNINIKNIKYLIHSHTAKVIASFGRSVVREVKQDLHLAQTIAFGTSMNNCASTLNAFEIAGMLLSEENENAKAIVVTGEMAFTPTVQVIPNTSITGDAAAAALISKNNFNSRLLSLEMMTDGRFSKGVWLNSEENKLFENIYVPSLAKTILKAIKKAGLFLSDIKMIIPHNVNLISWANTAKALNYDIKKIYLNNVKKTAHCFGADILINYRDAVDANCLKKNDYFLMATVGLGATFAAAVFQYEK